MMPENNAAVNRAGRTPYAAVSAPERPVSFSSKRPEELNCPFNPIENSVPAILGLVAAVKGENIALSSIVRDVSLAGHLARRFRRGLR
jgi:hypothetical protein